MIFTISDSQSVAGGLVVDLAVATYSCVIEGYIIEDANNLTCVSVNDTAQWYPAEVPVCEQGIYRISLNKRRVSFISLVSQSCMCWEIQAWPQISAQSEISAWSQIKAAAT